MLEPSFLVKLVGTLSGCCLLNSLHCCRFWSSQGYYLLGLSKSKEIQFRSFCKAFWATTDGIFAWESICLCCSLQGGLDCGFKLCYMRILWCEEDTYIGLCHMFTRMVRLRFGLLLCFKAPREACPLFTYLRCFWLCLIHWFVLLSVWQGAYQFATSDLQSFYSSLSNKERLCRQSSGIEPGIWDC